MSDVGVYPESMPEDWRKPLSGDFVSRQWLLTEYDKRHKGPPGGARKMIEEAPAADVRPVRPCDGCPFCVCEKHGVICPSDSDFRCDTRGGTDGCC